MLKRMFSLFFIVSTGLALAAGDPRAARADSTQTPARGAGAVSIGYAQDRYHRAFSDHGAERAFGHHLEDLDLTADATPAYNLIIAAPPGTPSISQFPLDFDGSVTVHSLILGFQFGITDNVAAGLSFPYFIRAESQSDLDATLLPAPPGTPGIPMPGLAQDVLTNQFGYDKVNAWRGPPGIGDVKLWSKYRFADTTYLKAAAGTWITFPTGTPDDDRDLMDVPYGAGCYSPAAIGMFDLTPLEFLTVNLTGRYIWTLPYERSVYMIDPYNTMYYKAEFPTRRRHGLYDPGDRFELETELRLIPAETLQLFAGYRYTQGYEARIDGHRLPRSATIERATWYGITVGQEPTPDQPAAAHFTLSYQPVISGRNTPQINRWAADVTVSF